MRRSAFAILLPALAGLLSAPGCDKTTGVAPLRDGKAECLDLQDLCRVPAQELGGRYRECDDIGRDDEGAECLREYDECKELCEAAPLGMGGAGGEGGDAEAIAERRRVGSTTRRSHPSPRSLRSRGATLPITGEGWSKRRVLRPRRNSAKGSREAVP